MSEVFLASHHVEPNAVPPRMVPRLKSRQRPFREDGRIPPCLKPCRSWTLHGTYLDLPMRPQWLCQNSRIKRLIALRMKASISHPGHQNSGRACTVRHASRYNAAHSKSLEAVPCRRQTRPWRLPARRCFLRWNGGLGQAKSLRIASTLGKALQQARDASARAIAHNGIARAHLLAREFLKAEEVKTLLSCRFHEFDAVCVCEACQAAQ